MLCLATEVVDDPDDETESDAENQTGDNGEIKSCVFTAMDDVAGKTAEAEGEFAAEIEKRADENENGAEKKKRTAEVAEIHFCLCYSRDAAEEVGLFGDGFGADGEGVEKIEAEGVAQGFVLAIA